LIRHCFIVVGVYEEKICMSRGFWLQIVRCAVGAQVYKKGDAMGCSSGGKIMAEEATIYGKAG
jgi:hypothetical protein